jgi:hypothetical protein
MQRLIAVGTLCLLVAASPASAEWHFTPMAGLTFAGDTTTFDWENAAGDTHPNFGGAVSLLGGGLFGVEGIAISTPGFFKSGGRGGTAPLLSGVRVPVKTSRSFAMMGNLIVTAPRRWTEYGLRPFVSGGWGLMHAAVVDGPEIFPERTTSVGFNVGGGALGFFSKRTGLRFDLRYYRTLHAKGEDPAGTVDYGPVRVNYMSLSVGLVFRR